MQFDKDGSLCLTLSHSSDSTSPNLLSTGIPFPQGVLERISQLSLTADKDELDYFCQPSARWPDNSIKWLEFGAICSDGLPGKCQLSVSKTPHKWAPISANVNQLTVQEDPEKLLIINGDSRFFLGKTYLTAPIANDLSMNSRVELQDDKGESSPARVENLSLREQCHPTSGHTKCLVVNMTGKFASARDNSNVWFEAYYRFYAGLSSVSFEIVIHNPEAAEHPNGRWDLGDPNSHYFQSVEINIPLVSAKQCRYRLDDCGTLHEKAAPDLHIVQHASGGKNWQSPVHVDKHNKVTLETNGYTVESVNTIIESGERCQPSIEFAYADRPGVAVSMEAFWQNFPSGLKTDESQLAVQIFPPQNGQPYELQGGEKKSHTVWFADSLSTLDGSMQKTYWHYPPSWIAACNVIAHFTEETPYQGIQQFIQQGIQGKESFFAKRESIDEYGWRNFGDLYADHETADHRHDSLFVSHYNNQYDPLYGMLRQYMLSGDQRWLSLADDLANHIIDIDIYHTEKDKDEYNGGLFWHTDHYLRAFTSSHRSYSKLHKEGAYMDHAGGGGPGGQHCYTTGLMLHHYLTGNPRSKEAVLKLKKWITHFYEGSSTCLELLVALRNRHVLGFKNVFTGQYPFDRGTANYINALLDSYELTQRHECLEQAEAVIKNTFHPLDNVSERELENVEYCWFYTVFLQAVCRYLFVKEHHQGCDDTFLYARDALIRYARWMAVNEKPYLVNPDVLEYPNDTWTAQDLRKVNVLLLANHYSNRQFPEMAEKAFELVEFITQKLAGSPEKHYCRILALLMQNAGIVEYYESAKLTHEYAPISTQWSSAAYQKNKTVNAISAVTKRLASFSLSKEIDWLTPRLSGAGSVKNFDIKGEKSPLVFVLSIDTEEEWDWRRGFPDKDFELNNIQKLPKLQAMFSEIGIRPTYFVDYAVANDDFASDAIKPFVQEHACEIGAHLHPWCNPPYYGVTGDAESHVVNLPEEQVEAKLAVLVDKLKEQFGVTPRSFRTGRWGIDSKVLKLLIKHGFNVDSSVYPFYRTEYFDCFGGPLLPYWSDIDDPVQSGSQRDIFQVPVTVGFNRKNFHRSSNVHEVMSHPLIRWARPVGIAWHTHLLRKLYLCPELSSAEDMISLTRRAIENDYPILHMYMHSSCLVDNDNSLVAQQNAFDTVSTAIKRVVDEVSKVRNVRFCTVSEAAKLLQNGVDGD